MVKYEHLLFDLDGTLTDPMLGITSSVRYALSHFGIEVEDLRSLCPFIGPPLIDSFMRFYGMDENDARVAVEKYREYFAARGIFENEMYPGMDVLLADLRKAGMKILLATSKPEEFAVRILEHFGIAVYFDFVGAATMDGRRSEKVDVVSHVLESMKLRGKGDVVMIGDRKYDIAGAHMNGIPAIGVLYGYGNKEELSSAGADYLVADLDGLRSLLL